MSTLLLLPRNVCITLLVAYRAVVSPLYGDVCRFYPSCSAYTLQAIQQHGMLKGIWLGMRRIARCHPWSAGGVDDIPSPAVALRTSKHGFVLASAPRLGADA